MSKNACLVMADHGDLIVDEDIDQHRVRAINLLVESQTHRFVIGQDEVLVRDVVAATGIEHTKPRLRFGFNPPLAE